MPELRFTVLGPVRAIANPDADSITYSSSAALPAPGSPRSSSTALRPARAASNKRSVPALLRATPKLEVAAPRLASVHTDRITKSAAARCSPGSCRTDTGPVAG